MNSSVRRPVYRDRAGRIITDVAVIEARYLQGKLAKLLRMEAQAGRNTLRGVTVASLSRATCMSPAMIVETIRKYDWPWGMTERGRDIGEWLAWEDGE